MPITDALMPLLCALLFTVSVKEKRRVIGRIFLMMKESEIIMSLTISFSSTFSLAPYFCGVTSCL